MNLDEELRGITIFNKLTDSQLTKIKRCVTPKNYSAGESVIVHGEESCSLYLILSGSVRATTYSLNGKEICFQHLEQGDIFGELSALDGLPRTTSIIVRSDCVLGMMTSEDIKALMQQYPEVMMGVVTRITSLVRFLCSRVYEYGALGTKERTRAEILRIAKDNVLEDGSALLENMPTHEDIANRIASHREAVTKEISAMVRQGLVEKQGRAIVVPSIEALENSLAEFMF